MAQNRDLEAELNRLEKMVDSGEISEARKIFDEIRSLASADDCRETGLHLRIIQARIAAVNGEYLKALEIGEALLASCRTCGNPVWIGRSHMLLSRVLERLGRHSDAQKHCEAAIHYCRWEIDDKEIEGTAWNNLGIIHKNLGLWEEAEQDLRRALRAYACLGDLGHNMRASLNLAVLLRKMGKIAEASNICREGLHLAGEQRDLARLCRFSLESANIAVIRRDAAEAAGHVERAWVIAREQGYQRELLLAYEIGGDVAGIRGDHDEALSLYRQGLGMARKFAEGSDLECELLRREGATLLAMGNLSEAKASIYAALKLAGALCDEHERAVCLRILGQTELREGLFARGIGNLAESAQRLYKLSPWCHEASASELAFGRACLTQDREVNVPAGLEHLLTARRIYANLGIGTAVREIDHEILTIIDRTREHRALMIAKTRGVASQSLHEIDLEQYGLITTDERIVGDVSHWGGSDVRVLIEGETGVGKELIARTLHALGHRHEHRFVVVDCGALSETLADSELFGHVKGAFTGAFRSRVGLIEEADGGTLLLDEVGELSEVLQAKLLRVLEEGEVRRVGENKCRPVDIRVISATTKDLGLAVEEGSFRRDLYYRLKGALIRVPSLHERPGDIDLLLDHFLRIQSEGCGREISLSGEARERLREYDWPGNVRELKSTVEALAVSIDDGAVICADSVERLILSSHCESGLQGRLKGIEREEIERALAACNGNKSKAARMLGISRRTLYYRLGREG